MVLNPFVCSAWVNCTQAPNILDTMVNRRIGRQFNPCKLRSNSVTWIEQKWIKYHTIRVIEEKKEAAPRSSIHTTAFLWRNSMRWIIKSAWYPFGDGCMLIESYIFYIIKCCPHFIRESHVNTSLFESSGQSTLCRCNTNKKKYFFSIEYICETKCQQQTQCKVKISKVKCHILWYFANAQLDRRMRCRFDLFYDAFHAAN